MNENAKGATGANCGVCAGENAETVGGDMHISSKDSKIDIDLPDPTVVVSSIVGENMFAIVGAPRVALGVICFEESPANRLQTFDILGRFMILPCQVTYFSSSSSNL